MYNVARIEADEERAAELADRYYDHFSTNPQPSTSPDMGMMKNYLLQLQENISEHQFGQDAVAWAISTGLVQLTYHLETDLVTLVTKYDSIIDNYRQARKNLAPLLELTMQFAAQAGLPITEIASADDTREAA